MAGVAALFGAGGGAGAGAGLGAGAASAGGSAAGLGAAGAGGGLGSGLSASLGKLGASLLESVPSTTLKAGLTEAGSGLGIGGAKTLASTGLSGSGGGLGLKGAIDSALGAVAPKLPALEGVPVGTVWDKLGIGFDKAMATPLGQTAGQMGMQALMSPKGGGGPAPGQVNPNAGQDLGRAGRSASNEDQLNAVLASLFPGRMQ